MTASGEIVTLTFQGGLVKASLSGVAGSSLPDGNVYMTRARDRVWKDHVRRLPASDVWRDADGRAIAADFSPEELYEIDLQTGVMALAAYKDAARRGSITGFSARSRGRLLELVARLRATASGLFVTLTYRKLQRDHREAKDHLDKTLRWLKRRLPGSAILWRMEYQRRGAIHFHLVVFAADFVDAAELTKYWQALTGDRSFPDVKRVQNRRQALAYVAKYVAKSSAGLDYVPYSEMALIAVSRAIGSPQWWWANLLHSALWVRWLRDGWTGRYWGVVNRERLPMARAVVISFRAPLRGLRAFFELRRAARRYWSGLRGGRLQGFKLFVRSAAAWSDFWEWLANDTWSVGSGYLDWLQKVEAATS